MFLFACFPPLRVVSSLGLGIVHRFLRLFAWCLLLGWALFIGFYACLLLGCALFIGFLYCPPVYAASCFSFFYSLMLFGEPWLLSWSEPHLSNNSGVPWGDFWRDHLVKEVILECREAISMETCIKSPSEDFWRGKRNSCRKSLGSSLMVDVER